MRIIGLMSDEKPKPLDDLKQGLGLLFRAAKGAAQSLPTEKIEEVVKDGAKEVGRAFESIGNEIDKAWTKATGSQPPPAPEASAAPDQGGEEKPKEPPAEPKFDDAYAPEPPKGPRVG